MASNWLRQTQASSHLVEYVDAVEDAAERLLAWTHGKDWHVCQAVHTLVGVGWEGSIGDEATRVVFGVDEVIVGSEASDVGGRETWAVLDTLV